MEIIKKFQEKMQDPNQDDLVYLLDFYSKAFLTKDLDQTISEANKLLLKTCKLQNIIFFSLFAGKLDLHSYTNDLGLKEIENLLSRPGLLEELKEKGELLIDKKLLLASYINKQFLAFFVFIGCHNNRNIEILKIHNQFISSLIAKEKVINDLVEHSQRATNLEQNLDNTVSLVSHELRTPLANILGFSELLINNRVSEGDIRKYNIEIYNSGQRLNGIIDNFLDFAKIKNGNLVDDKNFSLVDLENLCFKAWKQSLKASDNAEIAWLIDSNLPEIACDEAAIIRVVSNLFTNAIKYSKRIKTKIICEIKKLGASQVLVSVKDNGVGIPQDQIPQIFEKFYRADNATKDFIGGSGIGLWICKEIIEAHGGQIQATSIENQGTELSFTLSIRPLVN